MIGWLAVLLITIAVSVISTVLMPRPRLGQPAPFKDLEDPTSEAGREVPVIFGTILVKSGNIIWYGEKSIRTSKVKA